jgi:hypothetical protein
VFLDDDVGVGAADPEGGDAGAAGVSGVGPGLGVGEQGDAAGGPVDVGGGLVDVQGGWQGAGADGEDHFDQAGHAGGALGVADV